MQTIHKFQLILSDAQDVMLPRGAKPLTVQLQGQALCLWALVDTTKPLHTREVRIYGTGHAASSATDMDYLGTVQTHGGGIVWHVFIDRAQA